MAKKDLYDRITEYIIENQEKFYRFAYSYIKNREAALDVVQNAVCRALEKYMLIRDDNKINAWFYRVLLNETYAYMNKHKKEILTADEEMPEVVYNEKAYDRSDDVYDAINRLPKELKTIIILRFFEDLQISDIARITNTNINTVKTRLYSALKKLKKLYGEVYPND